jgi:hypothetical protein
MAARRLDVVESPLFASLREIERPTGSLASRIDEISVTA